MKKPVIVKFMYKCRQCGEVFDNGTRCRKDLGLISLVSLIDGYDFKPTVGQPPTMLDMHHCPPGKNDSVIGVADFIGFQPDYTDTI